MSFALTAYFNDAGIETTIIQANTALYTKYYGDDNLHYTDFTGRMIFEALPANGYRFYRWVYRLGSVSGTVQYSYDNPFTYSAEQDIFIHAESLLDEVDPGTEEWTLESDSLGELTAINREYVYMKPYTLYQVSVKFANSGEASFYTVGSFNTIGYLSTSPDWDSVKGEPENYVAFNDDGGENNNFKITFEVVAGQTYYIYIRGYNPVDSGQYSFYIEPPSSEVIYGSGGFYIFDGSQWVKTIPYVFSDSGWIQLKPCLFTGKNWYEEI